MPQIQHEGAQLTLPVFSMKRAPKKSGLEKKMPGMFVKLMSISRASGEESVVTMRGHPGENNVITCCPDAYMPVNTFPGRCSGNALTNKPGFYFSLK